MIERRFSWSRIDSYITCPYKYYLHYVRHISSKGKSKALSAGSAISKFLEVYRTGCSWETASKQMIVHIESEENNNLQWKKIDDPQRSVERLLEISAGYAETYPNEASLIVQPEITFEYPFDLDDTRIIFNGRLDGIISSNGTISLIEDKTTSRLGETFFKTKLDSFQILWYLWVAEKMGLFRIGERNQSSKCSLNAIYIHATNLRFEREITIKSKHTLDRSFLQLQNWLRSILRSEKENFFPKNFNSCWNFGGCEYQQIRDCEEDSPMFNRLLNSFYKITEPEHEVISENIE